VNVGELVAYLTLDDSQFRRTLDRANSAAASLGSTALTAAKGITAIGAGVQGISAVAGVLGTAAGAALVLPAAFVAIKVATAAATVGMQGFGDAMSSLEDPAAFAEAIEKLAPAAREAAIAVRDQKGAWDALQLDVQQNLFQGMGEHIRSLGGRYLPVLRGALSGVASDMNGAARATASWLDRDPAQATITTTLGHMREAIGNVLEAVSPLGNALMHVVAVGAEFLPGLTAGAGDAAEGFADMVANMRDSGELHAIISNGLDALGKLGQIAGNVGEILKGIFTAADTGGAGFLERLVLITQQIADMVNSAAGQETLTTFFQTAATLSDLFMQALSVLLPLLPPIVEVLGIMATTVGTALVGALTALAPYLQAFATWLAENPALVSGVTIALGLLLVAGNGLMALVSVMTTVQAVWATGMIQMAAGAVRTAVVWAAQWVVMAASSLLSAASMAASWLIAMGPVGWVIAAVVGLVALIIANWDMIVAATQQLVGRAGELLAWFGTLPGLFAQWFEGAKAAAIAKGTELLGWLGSLPGRILGLLSGLGSLLLGSGRALVDGFLAGIRGAWDSVVSFVRQGVQWVRDLFPFSPAKTGPFSGSGYVTHSGKALTGDFAQSLRNGIPGIIASARAAAEAAQGPLNATNLAAAGAAARRLARETADSAQAGAGTSFTVSAGSDGAMTPEDVLRRGGGPGAGGPSVSIQINNPSAERSSDSLVRAGATLAAVGPWGDE
jgi:hypothetical protein